MIYFGENNDYILCECEVCKREIYAERESVAEEDSYSYHLANPLRCSCGNIDEYINRSKKSCYHIRQELSALYDLLHKQQSIASRISSINAEINKKFNPPTFWQSIAQDFMFSGKIFFITLGSVLGLEIFLFIITLLMFISGLLMKMPDLSKAGNELFYNLNIFKDRGGAILSKFGMAAKFAPLDTELAKEQIIFNYIPYALAGVIMIVFYVFLIIFVLRAVINISKLVFFASKVVDQKIKVNRRREAYEHELAELKRETNSLDVKIEEMDILGQDYKNIKIVDTILKYFVNNRVDTIREAVNLYHEDDFKNKQLEYSKALYTEAKQTRRYTKAMYMLTSDSNIKVEVREEPAEPSAKSQAASAKPKKQSPSLEKNNSIARIKSPKRNNIEKIEKNEESKIQESRPEEPVISDSDKSESSKTETFSSIFQSEKTEQSEESTQE